MEQEQVQKMAEKYQVSAAQFLLRFLLQLGIGVIPKASVPERMRQNLELPEFTIEEEDLWFLRGLPQKAQAIGYSFPQLCEWILNVSMKKYANTERN